MRIATLDFYLLRGLITLNYHRVCILALGICFKSTFKLQLGEVNIYETQAGT